MGWWGKLIGGTLGFLLGGPLGALLGTYFGHGFDSNARDRRHTALPGDQERTQAAFFTATFSVMGHLAKADGRITRDEIDLANSLMEEMQLAPEQRKLARSLFNQGKSADFDFTAVVDQFRRECHRRSTLLRMFMEIQVQAAFADQRLDPAENRILGQLAEQLGFGQGELGRIIELVRGASHIHESPDRFDLEDAYAILGVDRNTPMDEVRRSYRRLLGQHHPDRLVAKGLPEEMIKLANEKTAEIRKAWEKIRDERGG
jgi:DnaJ like chaperone protein